MNGKLNLNVSRLPSGVLDYRSELWWGNLLVLFIETTMFALLAAAYFYVRMNTEPFPPPKWYPYPVVIHPLPFLGMSTLTLAILLVSCIPMGVADWAARREAQRIVRISIFISVVLCFISIVTRFFEFSDLQFRWDANAYSSTIWAILGMHMLHQVVAMMEGILILSWTLTRKLDDKHAVDTTVTAFYWFWVAGIWIPFYLLIYWGPRWFPK